MSQSCPPSGYQHFLQARGPDPETFRKIYPSLVTPPSISHRNPEPKGTSEPSPLPSAMCCYCCCIPLAACNMAESQVSFSKDPRWGDGGRLGAECGLSRSHPPLIFIYLYCTNFCFFTDQTTNLLPHPPRV